MGVSLWCGESGMLPQKAVKRSITDPLVVIIRHGKTEYNKLGVFTGWEVRFTSTAIAVPARAD